MILRFIQFQSRLYLQLRCLIDRSTELTLNISTITDDGGGGVGAVLTTDHDHGVPGIISSLRVDLQTTGVFPVDDQDGDDKNEG